jgi:uncharacterized protein YcnI
MSLLKRSAVVAALVGGLTFALAGPAAAHVTVNPNTAAPGGYAKVTFRAPNESDSAETVKIEVNMPADAPVASVSVKPTPGWTVAAVKGKLATPLKAHGSEITEAVTKITWTASAGNGVKPGQFQEFDVSMGPLPENVQQMVFKTLQTYSDGTVVRWIDEPTTDGTEPESPAPVLKLAAAPAAAAAAAPAPAAEAAPAEESGGSNALGIAGLVAGLAALVLALLAYQRAGRTAPAAAAAKSEPVDAAKS